MLYLTIVKSNLCLYRFKKIVLINNNSICGEIYDKDINSSIYYFKFINNNFFFLKKKEFENYYINNKINIIVNNIIKPGFFLKFFMFFAKFLFSRLQILLSKFINFLIYLNYNYLSIYLKNKEYLLFFIKYLKLNNTFLFKFLTDLTIVDYLNFRWMKRFKIVYNLFSLKFNYRLFLNLLINLKEGVNSLYFLFPNSNWLEREAWDMFGIMFFNHPDFRRILTDYGFKWYPLRKDFPLSGYKELWYDETIQDISYKPIKLMQEFRFYIFVSTWENII